MQETIADVLNSALANAGQGKGDHWLMVCHSGTRQSPCVLTASCAPDTWQDVSVQQSLALDLLLKKQALLFPSF